jgi:hypothetical protein
VTRDSSDAASGEETPNHSPVFSLISHRTENRAGFILWQLRVCFLQVDACELIERRVYSARETPSAESRGKRWSNKRGAVGVGKVELKTRKEQLRIVRINLQLHSSSLRLAAPR